MNRRLFGKVVALLLVLTMSFGFGCAKKDDTRTIAGYALEQNDGANAQMYPYIVRTPHATWYLAAADIELLGEEAFFEGLEKLLACQEADFADAYKVLDGYLKDEIPVIDVHTDFAAQTERAKWNKAGAYYLGHDMGIYLYRNWGVAGYALLHEYTHYLTYECCTFDLTPGGGFWAESIAEYVSMISCENRMGRAVNFGISDEELAYAEQRGLLDADGTLDMKKYYCFMAAFIRSGAANGATYSAVSETPITMSERLLLHPMQTTISYYEAASFFNWLVERYGRELVFANLTIGQERFTDVFGADFETLFFEWAADNDAWCIENGIVLGAMEE